MLFLPLPAAFVGDLRTVILSGLSGGAGLGWVVCKVTYLIALF